MKKISEMTPGEALTEQALAVFKRRLEQARKKAVESAAATKAVFDALEDMCIEPDEIPSACAYCKYYENMGGNRGRGSDGVCTARGTLYATRGIRVSKERLDNCPLRIITGGRK